MDFSAYRQEKGTRCYQFGVLYRFELLDSAFVSRFPIKYEMLPFRYDESQCMIQKFLSDIGFEKIFSEEEIRKIIENCGDQRQVMNRTVQALAEKIAMKSN